MVSTVQRAARYDLYVSFIHLQSKLKSIKKKTLTYQITGSPIKTGLHLYN